MKGICHVEFPCQDMEKAGKFYADVFGWEITPMPQIKYAMFKAPDGIGGGFNTQAKVSEKPGILLYIEVEDIEACLSSIEGHGGKQVQPKTQISPEHGYFALFADIEGNTVGLWAQK